MKLTRIIYRTFTVSILTAGILTISYVLNGHVANGVSANLWNAGRIIDDSVFTNKDDMTVADIQNFLNNKVPICDNWGEQTTRYSAPDYNNDGRITRAEYARSIGLSTPFTCLKDYYEVPKTSAGPNVPANNYGGKPTPAGAQSAAQLIANAAQKYSISPRILLVKLATESAGPLTTDDWPFERQYLYAMGAHCPDSGLNGSANCDSNWSGFSLQMDEAASLLRWYIDSMAQPWWPYKKPYQVNNILWNVQQSGCGGADVYIATKATAALYTYTPYQPNQAALNNMYGTGDNCSAYGNRNFWRVYQDWFGSTLVNNPYITLSSSLVINNGQPFRSGQMVTATFAVRNSHNNTLNSGIIGIAGRDKNGANRDIAFMDMTIPGNSSKQVSWQFTASEGIVNYWVAGLVPEMGWMSSYPASDPDVTRAVTTTILPNPTIASGPSLNTDSLRTGVPVTASYSVKNYTPTPVTIGTTGLAMRTPDGRNADVAYETPTIPANGSYTYSKTFAFSQAGEYKAWIANYRPTIGWNNEYPVSDPGTSRRSNIIALPSLVLSTSLTLNTANAIAGQPVSASFSIKNYSSSAIDIGTIGVAIRNPAGQNVDLGYEAVVVPAGQTYTYSKMFTFASSGTYRAWVANYTPSFGWRDTYPLSDSSATIRSAVWAVSN